MPINHHVWFIGCIFMLLSLSTLGQSFKDDAPRYNYDTLPKTSFSCQGRLTGRYYADVETDCQLFHVCVKMSARDIHDFKFLCPNGTTFDQEHQVCMDYYQVVCHSGIGTNPLGHIYELMKLSSNSRDAGLDAGKVSFIDPDVAERNTLGDDFQVDEYNNNRLASSQNALNYQSSKSSNRKSSQDIFYKSFASSTKYTTSTTTPRPSTTSSTTSAPLVFRSPIPTNEPVRSSSVSPRRPSLETFESYETESIAGLTAQNSFNGGNVNPKNLEDSYEIRDPEPSSSTTTTTRRPAVFHNTFRTSFPETSSTAVPPAQTFQQQASRFNEDFFRKLPAPTDTAVSKAAQFYVNSNTKYSTPEVRQPTTNPFFRGTTESSFSTRQSSNNYYSSTSRPLFSTAGNSGFQYEVSSTPEPFRRNPTTEASKQYYSAKSNDRGLSNRGQSTFPASSVYTSTTSAPQNLGESSRHSKFFVPPQSQSPSDEFNNRPNSFNSKYVDQQDPEDVIRPRSFSGTTNVKNTVSNKHSNRDNFGFSTIPPPTTAEPRIVPTTTTTTFEPIYDSSRATSNNNNGNTYFQRLTTLKPEKFSIFFGKSTTYANKEYTEKETRFPTSGGSTVVDFYEPTSTYRPQTTRKTPIEYESSKISSSDSSRLERVRNFDSTYISSTPYSFPDETSTTTTTTTTTRPLRRGARRRINRPRQQPPKKFDPEFKYSRRVESASSKEKESYAHKNEEIFSAEASVFRGNPDANLFHRQDAKSTAKAEEPVVETQKQKATFENSPKLSENFGRRIRPNTKHLNSQFIRPKVEDTPPVPAVEEQPQQQTGRRLVKRIKIKPSSTPTPDAVQSASSTTLRIIPSTTTTTTTQAPPVSSPTSPASSAFPFSRSTLRPVTRINVKTKIANRKIQDSEFPVFQSKNPFLAFEKQRKVSTTEEPELVTASDDEILRKKLKKFSTAFVSTKEATTSTTSKPVFIVNEKKNSSVIIKVTTKAHSQPFPTPISFKEPILSKFDKKESRVEVKHSISEDGSSKKSPDYDYIYYNTDDDYKDESSLLKQEHKNYGKKPVKKALVPAA